MKAGKRCVDTSLVVRYLNGESALRKRFEEAGETSFSPVVVGELLFGAAHSRKPAENLAKIESFTRDCVETLW